MSGEAFVRLTVETLTALGVTGATLVGDLLTIHFADGAEEIWTAVAGQEAIRFDGRLFVLPARGRAS